jgi:hypothetical protein
MLINRLLKRDEIEGFVAVPSAVTPRRAEETSESTETEMLDANAEPPKPKPAPPGQRARRRHRRAL